MLAFLAYSLFLTGPKIDADITYAKLSDIELKMDIYHPTIRPVRQVGAVVVIHGGGWMGGKRQDMDRLCQEIAKRGLVAATIQYRLAPKYKWPAMIDDVQTAVRYLRANASKYNIDPMRIGATGASAGGHLSLLLGFSETHDQKPTLFAGQSSKVSAVLNIFGPTDMSQDYDAGWQILFGGLTGKKQSEFPAFVKDFSPVNYITKGSAPVFTVHGAKDPLVPVIQSKRLEDKLKAVGVPCTTRVIEGMGHEVALSNPACKKAMEEGLAWLVKQLSK